MLDVDIIKSIDLRNLTELQFLTVVAAVITVIAVVVILLARSLFGRGFAPGDSPGAKSSGKSARRHKTVFDEQPASGFLGRLNQGFDRLVLESGLNVTPVTAFLMFLAWGLLSGGVVLVFLDNPLGSLGAAMAAIGGMLLVLAIFRRRRMNQIRAQIPYAADLLARGVRAGESLDQAIAMVGRESAGPLGGEFQRCSRQLEMGRSMNTVMRSFTSRVRLMESRVLASPLTVHRTTGGNLAVALERMAQTIRDRTNYRRQLKASTGAARTSAFLIAFITPIVFLLLFFWQPEHFRQLLEDPLGRTLLMAALILEVVGIVWVLRLLRTD